MNFPNKQRVEMVRTLYPQGTLVMLVAMRDPYSKLKPGDRGVVSFVDDAGTIFVNWFNGSSLGIVYGVDRISKA